MELFIKIYFWIAVLGIICNIGTISSDDFPKVESHGMGWYVAKLFISIPFAAWAAMLVWG